MHNSQEFFDTNPGRFQILLIDDNEADAKLFEHALREAAPRVRVYWLASGDEALEYLEKRGRFERVGSVSIVVSDLNMPGLNGYELLSRIKKSSTLKSVPFIVYSGSASARDITLCYSLGANSYIVKPMTMDGMVEQLKSMVHYWLETVRLADQSVPD